MANVITVGRFTFDPASQQISGPAEFMRTVGSTKLDAITSGRDAGFNAMLAAAPKDTGLTMLVLVAMQTAFAGWLGMKQFEFAALRGRL